MQLLPPKHKFFIITIIDLRSISRIFMDSQIPEMEQQSHVS